MTLSLRVPSFGPAALGAGLILIACGGTEPPPSNSPQSGGSAGVGGSSGSAGMGASSGTGARGGSSGSTGAQGGSSGGGTTGQAGVGGAGGAGVGGAAGSPAGGSAGATGGGAGVGGAGGADLAGAGGASAGMGGSGGAPGGAGPGGMGGSAGSPPTGWTCPSGLTGKPTLGGTPMRVVSVPPPDPFNMNNGNFGNIEGPVWIDDALYVSEMSYMAYDSANGNVKMSRILKVTSAGQASIHVADSGSNGLAVDADGNIVAAVHKDGSITRLPLPSGAATPIVSMYMSARFDSPNDLAIRSDGTIYFTDPNFQAPNSLPQAQTRVYRVAPGAQAEPIPSGTPDMFGNPNGITLSLAEDFLYVAAQTGRRYPVMTDGSIGAGQDFAAASGGDGMAIDCAGNLYVAKANSTMVSVYEPNGTSIGNITVGDVQAVTNVAFGGADHKTLYITGLGNNKGLFTLTLDIPGRPY